MKENKRHNSKTENIDRTQSETTAIRESDFAVKSRVFLETDIDS